MSLQILQNTVYNRPQSSQKKHLAKYFLRKVTTQVGKIARLRCHSDKKLEIALDSQPIILRKQECLAYQWSHYAWIPPVWLPFPRRRSKNATMERKKSPTFCRKRGRFLRKETRFSHKKGSISLHTNERPPLCPGRKQKHVFLLLGIACIEHHPLRVPIREQSVQFQRHQPCKMKHEQTILVAWCQHQGVLSSGIHRCHKHQ